MWRALRSRTLKTERDHHDGEKNDRTCEHEAGKWVLNECFALHSRQHDWISRPPSSMLGSAGLAYPPGGPSSSRLSGTIRRRSETKQISNLATYSTQTLAFFVAFPPTAFRANAAARNPARPSRPDAAGSGFLAGAITPDSFPTGNRASATW